MTPKTDPDEEVAVDESGGNEPHRYWSFTVLSEEQ